MAKLYFKWGCMGCSKSMDLLRTAYNYESKGDKVLLIKPSLDTRSEDKIWSRIGIEKNCILVNKDEDIQSLVMQKGEFSCILVDEAQFLTVEQVEQLWRLVIECDIPVMAWGLKVDYRGKGFPASNRLFDLAHSTDELKTMCSEVGCKKKATHHLLKVDGECVFDGDGVHIGDTEYSSVCGNHWLHYYNEYINKMG